jgi:hypothetical protein
MGGKRTSPRFARPEGFLEVRGYDVEAWIKEQLAKDGCHLD